MELMVLNLELEVGACCCMLFPHAHRQVSFLEKANIWPGCWEAHPE